MQFRRRRYSRFSNTLRTLKRAAVRWEVKNFERIAGESKVTQTMTHDGLVMENQATGTVENVSTREAERDYSTDAEGKAEKILERAEDIKDGHENKKKAKKATETAATAESKMACTVPLPFGIDEKNGQTRRCSRTSKRRERKPTSWMQPAPLCRKSASQSRKKFTMQAAARQNPPCALSSRTKARPA